MDQEKNLQELESICSQQYEQIRKKNIQIKDLEAEVYSLYAEKENLSEKCEKAEQRIGDLERWCSHLQAIIDEYEAQKKKEEEEYEKLVSKYGAVYRLGQKVRGRMSKNL